MSASNKYYLRIAEEEVNDLPNYLKERMTFIDDNSYKGNELYDSTLSMYVKAKKQLEIVKFKLRHNLKK